MTREKTKIKILHGPYNICGLGGIFADHQKGIFQKADFITFFKHDNFQNHDHCYEVERYGTAGKIFIILYHFFWSVFEYNTFHFYFGVTLLPFNLDLPILKLLGKKIIMSYCGSDVRLFEIERRRNPYISLLETGRNKPENDGKKKLRMLWHNFWVDKFTAGEIIYKSVLRMIPKRKVDDSMFVSVDGVDTSEITPKYASKKIPKIVHAPTDEDLKGTKYLEKTLENLKEKGLSFEYMKINDRDHDEAMKDYRTADIIVDQLLIGGMGKFSVEAMALGKPVVVYLNEDIASELPDVPIVNANIHNLDEVLTELIQCPKKRKKIGKRARKFVENHCEKRDLLEEITKLTISL